MTGELQAEAIRDRIRRREGTGLRTFYTTDPVVWQRTAGAHVWDADGRRFLDLHAGFAVATIGYCHPRVTEAIVRQASTMTHCPTAAPSMVRAEFYESLAQIVPPALSRFFPSSTGAFANEMAISLARANTGRSQVVAFSGGYAGRTQGTLGVASKRDYRERAGVLADAMFLPYPDPYRSDWCRGDDPADAVIGLLEHLIGDPASGLDPLACIMVEPIQGNGGVVIPDDRFLRALRRICDETGAVLIFDEIQSGFGRSGSLWAAESSGVVPDLMTIGKGIGGGLPIAAVAGREGLMSQWTNDTVAGTFIAHALAMVASAAAVGVLQEEGLVSRSRELGAHTLKSLRSNLAGVPGVGDVRGRGLFIAVELVSDSATKAPATETATQIALQLRRRGYLIGRCGRFGNVLKLSPPLTIDEAELAQAVTVLSELIVGADVAPVGVDAPATEALSR